MNDCQQTTEPFPEYIKIHADVLKEVKDNGKEHGQSGPCHRRTPRLELADQRDDHCEGRDANNRSLVEAIAERDWTAATHRLQSRPEEARASETVVVRGRRTKLLPLHYTCTLRPPVAFVGALIDAAPETAHAADSKGRLALHWACDATASCPDVIRLLLDVYGDGASTQEDKYGFLPIHIACFWESPTTGNDGDSDGDEADRKTERARIVEMLVEAFPKGIWYRDNKNWLPLHIAARTGTAEVVKLLLDFPAGAIDADKDGRLPIHLACLNAGADDDVVAIINSLAKSNPEGLRTKETRFGFLPLHIACSTPTPSKCVVEALLDHYPHAAREEDNFLSSPLHVAARANAPHNVIEALVRVYPDAARLLDRDERLPLHWACHADAPREVIQTLLDPFPSGMLVDESKYGYTPLHIAVHRGVDDNVISAMLSCMPQAASIADVSGALPLHIVCKQCTRAALPTLKKLLDAHPKGVETKDRMERTPADLAMQCKDKEMQSAMLKILQERNVRRSNSKSSTLSESKPKTKSKLSSGSSRKSQGSSGGGSDGSSPGICVICLERPVTHFLYPCGHACLCSSCARNKLDQLSYICPVGRCEFRKAKRVCGHV